MKNFPGQAKSLTGNFIFSLGNLEKMKKLRKSQEFKHFPKKNATYRASGNFIFQAIYDQKHFFSNIYGLRCFFKD